MGFDFQEHILHHMQNSQEWHLPFLPPVHLLQPLSLHSLMLLIAFVFLILLFCVLYRKDQAVPKGITNMLEAVVVYIRDEICIVNLGEEDGRRMTPLFCTFFFFILCLNLMGLIPLFSTATSNISVTGALAIITFCFMVFGSIYRHGVAGFFKSFVPSGIPLPVLFLIVPIEILGLFIKTFALTIRLFANMLSGHVTIAALLGLIILLGYVALPMMFLALFIYLLEVLVVFIQAYVFTFLSAIFIGQMYHPEH
ncbi:MAG: ATP synthase F0 subunit A [Omnitrophica WOR_2 bacterium RIFCSPHIGHO2_01_FULL_48_9]|nr:MAG: ATP synthase F0 subunit A [Omnitrophica WOR_2 bacterium RIFCSPHIGHO2_02_FULL_48_11]OGX30252.1 MAG: ATP synthase F0 subunit A [Omnitrophica WOR_2 bacterium RIFCSPHIGHO2_01_FULL_48_9]